MKKQKKEIKEECALPFREKKITGKIEGKSCIAYSLSLPHLTEEAFQEGEVFLDLLKDAFLTFLRKMSEEEREEVMFGGITFHKEGQKAILFSCFSPFGERSFSPFATLLFSEEGKLLRVLQTKEKKRER